MFPTCLYFSMKIAHSAVNSYESHQLIIVLYKINVFKSKVNRYVLNLKDLHEPQTSEKAKSFFLLMAIDMNSFQKKNTKKPQQNPTESLR